jgi:hypothetical protein
MLTIQEWIREVDDLRRTDELLAHGAWHGYLAPGDGGPMRGGYLLVRWARPTVAVSHDLRDVAVSTARVIETAIMADGA